VGQAGGYFVVATKRSEGGRPVVDKITGSKIEPVINDAPTLSDLGINKKTSSLAQKLAALPDAEVTVRVMNRNLVTEKFSHKNRVPNPRNQKTKTKMLVVQARRPQKS
jgi:hypothetical protein